MTDDRDPGTLEDRVELELVARIAVLEQANQDLAPILALLAAGAALALAAAILALTRKARS